jgi:hypothetical protein
VGPGEHRRSKKRVSLARADRGVVASSTSQPSRAMREAEAAVRLLA